MVDLFPRGVAVGEAFYDRIIERAYLKSNIDRNIHTVLIAPRRFGKTSLMSQVLHEANYPHIWLDFMTITSREDVQLKLMEKVSELIIKLSPWEDKLKALMRKYFKKLKPEIVLSVSQLSLRLHPVDVPQQGIEEVLIELDKLAQEVGQRVVIVLDEFQEIISLEERGTALQASIRHAAERAKSITYIFSGSKHQPLKKLFHGKNNPLYQLCDQMNLERVSENDYREFINKAALEKWGHALAEEVVQKILFYTNRYPKYVNALCGSLWTLDKVPSVEDVGEIWHSYLFSRKTDIAEELDSLKLNQKRLLRQLALDPTAEPYSKNYLNKLKLSQSSVQAALALLLEKGLVVKWEDMFRVLDPTFRDYFQM
jgi:uncharacterized protein